MRFSKIAYAILIGILVYGCNTETGTTIKGKISGSEDLTAFLDIKSMDNAVQSLANTKIDGQGNFSFNFPDPEGIDPGLYRLRIGAKGLDLVLSGTEKTVAITGDMNELQNFNYTVTGSDLSTVYQQKIQGVINKTLARPAIDGFIKNETDPLLATALSFATTPANPASHAMYKDFATRIKNTYPKAALGPQLEKFSNEMAQRNKQSRSKYNVELGQPAPEIALPDVKGKIRKLSDLKGKVVLLDFWASWCGPCRRSNPHVVEMYDKYNKDGFEVFNVSLDGLDTRSKKRYPADQLAVQMENQKKRWLDAIKKDNLKWDNHVSDLKKWESVAAAEYGVRSIPTTFLIGRDGTIAALNPRNNLEQEIKKAI